MRSKKRSSFGEKLASLRKSRGFTQEEFSGKIDISRRSLAYYESETAKTPVGDVLLKMAKSLDITVDDLLGASPLNQKAFTPNEARLAERLRKIERRNGMSTLISEARTMDVWFDEDNIWLSLDDGRQISTPLAFYPRLLNATVQQRDKWEMIGDGIGVHWEDIDEDLSTEGIILGRKSQARQSHLQHV